jgi:hypothetical protein
MGEHGVIERLLQPESNLNLRHTGTIAESGEL